MVRSLPASRVAPVLLVASKQAGRLGLGHTCNLKLALTALAPSTCDASTLATDEGARSGFKFWSSGYATWVQLQVELEPRRGSCAVEVCFFPEKLKIYAYLKKKHEAIHSRIGGVLQLHLPEGCLPS